MTWIRRYKQKRVISQISVDFNSTFTSYAWRWLALIHRLMCLINSRQREFIYVKIAFILHWNDFCIISLWKCASLRRDTNRCKISKIWHFWERPPYEIWEYTFKAWSRWLNTSESFPSLHTTTAHFAFTVLLNS